MFSCLTIFTAGTEVRITNFEFVEKMAAEAMVVRSKSEYNDLFLPGEAVIWIVWIVVLMLLCPSLFHFSFEYCFFFSKTSGIVSLFN